MSWYPFLVDCAWRTLGAVLSDWQQNPYMWSRERDIQLELASRLTTAYKQMGCNSIEGRLPWAEKDAAGSQSWPRVACEPYMQYRHSDKKLYRCHPDVVIWDEPPNKNWTPNWKEEENWPVLWACELKYGTKKHSNWDQEKLTYLVEQEHIRFGCWVKISHRRAKSGRGWNVSQGNVGKRLWIYEIEIPHDQEFA